MISVKNLWKSFNGTPVLKGLNLEVHDGETLVILGRSGSGKSVLLRHIMRMERPDSGSVEIQGQDITSLKEDDLYPILRDMGMLFQASALFDSLTIKENTAFYLHHHDDRKEGRRLPLKEIYERADEALAMVGLEGIGHLLPADLSGGMRKRAALARLIAYKPHILLYDEPTTGLDPITAMQINDLILKIQKELHATSIVVTHDICSAFHVADRVAFHHEGTIAYVKTKEEFIEIDDSQVQAFLNNSIPFEIIRKK